MKFLLFSDLHLDAPFAWLGTDREAARRRRQALREAFLRIVRLASEVKADALLCGGDLYEQDRFSPDTAAFLRATLATLDPLPVYLAPGNHDWYGPRSLYHQTHWSPNVHIYRNDRLEPVTVAEGLTLWGAAHRAPANTPGFLDGFRVDRGGIHLALFHGSELSGLPDQETVKLPHAPFASDQIRQAGLHHVLLGHYHRPREAASYTYPGNPESLAFGEDGLRGAVIVTVAEDGTVVREWRRVAVTDIHDLTLDVAECASQQDVRDLILEILRGRTGVARVTLTGELRAEVELQPRDLSALAPWLGRLQVRIGAVRPAYDLDVMAQEQTVRGQFVRDVRAADLPEDVRRRVLLTGLRALDGRTDLEVG